MGRSSLKIVSLEAKGPSLAADLDRRITEMRELLAVMKPATTASALRVLRDSFPDIPLNQRIRVLMEARE